MRKDKKWLKEKVDRLFFDNSMSNNPYLVAKREAITEISNLIDQLDEPEVLSEEWIDKNKFEVNGWNEAVHVEDLQNLLVPKQDKPVIPQFVADYYNDFKKYELTFAEWFKFPEFGEEGKTADKTFEWLLDNSHEVNIERQFILADIIAHGLDGYEVEKEKLYCVKFPSGHFLYRTNSEGNLSYLRDNYQGNPDVHIFTEKEIKAIDERYWAFAVEVTE